MAMREIHDDDGAGRKPEKAVVTPARVVVAVLVVLFIWWCFTNRQTVNVTVLFFDRDMPLFVVLIVAFLVGLAAGALLWSRRAARRARNAKA